jgi:RNA polymerase sigma factor (sigma-70 family)
MDAAGERTHDFEASVEPLLGLLYGRALRLCRNRADAEDLVQEAVLRAWRFWPGFEPGTNLAAWLSRILKHCFVDGHHRRRRERDVLVQAWQAGRVLAAPATSFDEPVVSDEGGVPQCRRARRARTLLVPGGRRPPRLSGRHRDVAPAPREAQPPIGSRGIRRGKRLLLTDP